MTSHVRDVQWKDRTAIVEVAGEIDLNGSQAFQRDLLKVFDQHPDRMVVDLGGVVYMDSSGVASLVKLLSRARKSDVALMLVNLQPRVRSVLEITRLDTVFDIRDTREEALD